MYECCRYICRKFDVDVVVFNFSLSHQKNHETVFKLQFRRIITAAQPLTTQASQSKMKPSVVSDHFLTRLRVALTLWCYVLSTNHKSHKIHQLLLEMCLNFGNTNHACHNGALIGSTHALHHLQLAVSQSTGWRHCSFKLAWDKHVIKCSGLCCHLHFGEM